MFAAADPAADGGAIDGRVSREDLAALIDLTDDRDVIAMCRHFVDHPDAFERIDRESPHTGFDGTIADPAQHRTRRRRVRRAVRGLTGAR